MRNTALPGRKRDIPSGQEAEHGETHVVVQPMETLPSLRQHTEAVHQTAIQPLVLQIDLRYLEVISRDHLRPRRLSSANFPGQGGHFLGNIGEGQRPSVKTLDVT